MNLETCSSNHVNFLKAYFLYWEAGGIWWKPFVGVQANYWVRTIERLHDDLWLTKPY